MEDWKDERGGRMEGGMEEGWKDGRLEGWKEEEGRLEGEGWKDGRMEGWNEKHC